MPHCAALTARWLIVAAVVCLSSGPLAAQDHYLRLDDGLYELNADGTYHKVKGSSASSPQPSSSPSRPATTSSSGRFTGQERFMRFDDGLYERMADGSYTKVDERRQVQQSQSGGYGASSTSSDPRWQQQFGQQHYSGNRPPQWSNNSRPPQWSNNSRPPQWNNSRPPATDSMLMNSTTNGVTPRPKRPQATDSMLMNSTGQDKKYYAPNPMVEGGRRPPRPGAVDPMLMNGTGQGLSEHGKQEDPWFELGRSIRGVIEAEARRGRSGR